DGRAPHGRVRELRDPAAGPLPDRSAYLQRRVGRARLRGRNRRRALARRRLRGAGDRRDRAGPPGQRQAARPRARAQVRGARADRAARARSRSGVALRRRQAGEEGRRRPRPAGERGGVMRAVLCAIATTVLAGCGFQLRGQQSLPFESLYIPGTGPLSVELRRNIHASSKTKLVDNPKLAQAVVGFTEETRDKVILTFTSAGKVNEYRLRYTV